MTGRRWGAAALAGCAVYLLMAWRLEWLCDDAFISFRYARHLAQGLGLAFNPGESPPAEGYSDFLWVLLLAAFEAVGIGAPRVAPLLSAACGVALVTLVARAAARQLQAGALATWSAALCLGAFAPMAVWATSGMETTPFALALCVLLLALEAPARGWVLAAAVTATALLRVDGPLWACAALLGALALPSGRACRRRAALLGLGVLVAVIVLHSGLRIAYHGDLVPNTVRVKGGFSILRIERGLLYAASFLALLPVAALLPPAAILAAGGRLRGLALRASWIVAFGLGLTILVGGDFLPMGRLLVPILAAEALLLAVVVERLAARGWRPAAAAVGALAVLLAAAPAFDLHVVPSALRERLDSRWSLRVFRSELAQWRRVVEVRAELELLARALALHTRPGESLVEDAVGVVGYRTELVLHDRFGLVDREVARLDMPLLRASAGHDRAVNPPFFLDRRPDYLEAYLVAQGTPLGAVISPELSELVGAGYARVEGMPLEVADGFPPGIELRLVRFLPPGG